jgi:DNA invertase Pin-like site-specific DNA recombinase
MKRAATYARFSTDKQTETSIEDQRRCCAEYAKLNGLSIVVEFSDLAISGASFGNRPGVNQLQRAAFAGEIDLILIADLTRLSRNSADLPKFLERMRFRKIRVVGVLDHFDSDLRHSRMQAGLSGIMSDEYRLAIGERVHLSLDTLAKSGKPTGSKAYGYTSKQVVIPEQAAIVKEIFGRVAAGETMYAICCDLNARQIRSPGASWKGRTTNRSDGRWIVPALNALLQNELYRGRVVWNRSQWVKDPETGKRTRRERPVAEWVIDERPELALVDRPIFDTVAALMARRKLTYGKKGGGRSKYPLSGLLVCGECDARFVMSGGGKNSRGYGSGQPRYYTCATFHQGGPHACSNSIRVAREICEERLMEPALNDLLSAEAVDKAVIRIRKMLKERPPEPVADISGVEAKVAKIRALVEAGALDGEMAETLFAKLEAERLAIVREAHRAARPPLLSGAWGLEAEYREHAERLRADLKGEDADVARAALTSIYGPRIRLIPAEGNTHLLAEVHLQANAILAAAGASVGRISLSSGGLQSAHIPLIRKG